jgi:DNA-binding MarR family transcriptional regulator
LQDTTVTGSSFPDDELRRTLQRLVRLGGLLEPHQHAGLKVSLSELMALGELADLESMSQQDLADRLGLEKSTVSRLAAGLERRAWIVRQRTPSNRRFYQLKLTDEGRAAAERVGKALQAHHQQLLGGLTLAERHALTIGLAGVARTLEAQRQPHACP